MLYLADYAGVHGSVARDQDILSLRDQGNGDLPQESTGAGKKLLVLTADGRMEEIRPRGGKTLRETQFSDSKNGLFRFAGETKDGLWVLDPRGGNAFCLDTDKLACSQELRGTWALDFEHSRAYLSDEALTGSLPIRTAREIIALGRQAAGDTPLSDEVRRRFGA